jgi:hypothetical protein
MTIMRVAESLLGAIALLHANGAGSVAFKAPLIL